MKDNYDLWCDHDYEERMELEKLPVCDYCREHIQDDHFYKIEGMILCEECLNDNYRHSTY